MKLFGFELGRKAGSPAPAEPAGQFAPNTRISYDPTLIPHFIGHHRELMTLVAKVRNAAVAGHYPDVDTHLRSFRSLLQDHLLQENVRLYSYLSHCLKNDVEGSELMGDMRNEMGEIGRLVMRFLKQHIEFGVSGENVAKFIGDLDKVIAALTDRTKREEQSLYTLYRAPGEFTGAG